MTYAGERTGRKDGRERCREDEARGAASDEIDQGGAAGDVTAHDAKRLTERSLNDGEAVHDAVALGNAAAARAVEPDGMNLIEIGHGAMAVGDVAELGDRGNVAIHGVNRFETDEFRAARIARCEKTIEVGRIVVAENPFLGAAVSDTGDHRRMIERIGKDNTARDLPGERR